MLKKADKTIRRMRLSHLIKQEAKGFCDWQIKRPRQRGALLAAFFLPSGAPLVLYGFFLPEIYMTFRFLYGRLASPAL